MKIYFLISLIFYLFYLTFKSRKSLLILQQNWYNDGNKYLKWVFNNPKKIFLTYDLLFIIFLFFKGKLLILLFSLFYVIVYFLYKKDISKEQSKKPLVITARIKRLYVTELIEVAVVLEVAEICT